MTKDPNFWKKLGRNNKNRGRAFEKKVAAVLNWTRVPYSGGSGAWGEGDVVDGFYARRGKWFAECKTQPYGVGNVSIRKKWIDRCLESARKENRLPVIITSLYGRSEAWVFLPFKSWFRWCHETGLNRDIQAQWNTVARGAGGFCVQKKLLDEDFRIAQLLVIGKDDTVYPWIIMSLDHFKELVEGTAYFVLDRIPDEEE